MSGREGTQLQYLERYYEKEGSQLIIFYGQKNSGMRDMLYAFCQSKPHSYYRARACSEREQLFLWGNELRENGAVLSTYPSYGEIFDTLIATRTRKRVIVIEEFQNLVKQSADFMPQLVRFLKNEWNNQQIIIILCSTSIGWIENSMVSRIGSAAYEISGFLKIKEKSFAEFEQYFSKNSRKQCIEMYAVLGGFSDLWKYFENGASVKENICRHILRQNSFLHEEALRLVAEELRETGVYHTILATLASGKQKLNDIYLHTGFSRAKISVYLKNLMELELVEKVFVYDTAGRENAQKGIYRIKNRFVSFYFRYLYPHMSRLAEMTPETFFETYVEQDFPCFVEEAFKDVCREAVENLNEQEKLPFAFTKTGEWIGKVGNIDIVAEDETGHILIGLCAWEKKVMLYEDYEWLLFCAQKAKLSVDCIYLFADGFDEKLSEEAEKNDGLRLMDMEAL